MLDLYLNLCQNICIHMKTYEIKDKRQRMAVPKKRTSRSKKNSRKANWMRKGKLYKQKKHIR